MSISKSKAVTYQKTYVNLRFERKGLFELLWESYHPKEVLYPGCANHITPAFFFPHVVFVDQDPATMAYFSNHESILDLVRRNRKYRRSPYIQFIFQDFIKPLPVYKNQFDLILALYTGGVSKACKSYLKIGGLLVTNNHQNDAVYANQDDEFTLIATVQKHQGKYRLKDNELSGPNKIRNQESQPKRYLRQTNSGFEYIENESYYIFKRTRPRR